MEFGLHPLARRCSRAKSRDRRSGIGVRRAVCSARRNQQGAAMGGVLANPQDRRAELHAFAKRRSGAERRVYPTPGPTKRQRFRRDGLRTGLCSPVGGELRAPGFAALRGRARQTPSAGRLGLLAPTSRRTQVGYRRSRSRPISDQSRVVRGPRGGRAARQSPGRCVAGSHRSSRAPCHRVAG